MNMKAVLLLALTLMAAVSIVVGAAITQRTANPTSPSTTGKTATATDFPTIRPLGETIGDPTAPG